MGIGFLVLMVTGIISCQRDFLLCCTVVLDMTGNILTTDGSVEHCRHAFHPFRSYHQTVNSHMVIDGIAGHNKLRIYP